MPGSYKAKKDVISCEKPRSEERRVGKRRLETLRRVGKAPSLNKMGDEGE